MQDKNISSSYKSLTNILMVDSGNIVQQYNRQQQQDNAEKIKKQKEKQTLELQRKYNSEQLRLKYLKEESVAIGSGIKPVASNKVQKPVASNKVQKPVASNKVQKPVASNKVQKPVASNKVQKPVASNKVQKPVASNKVQKPVASNKVQKPVASNKVQKPVASNKVQKPVASNKVQKPVASNKVQKPVASNVEEIDDFFDQLVDIKNATKVNLTGKEDKSNLGVSSKDINNYARQIQDAITNKFHTDPVFIGETCNLRINIASDGTLLSVTSEGGAHALCQSALSAAKRAYYPKPANNSIYQIFKHFNITFKPN
ncbi:cell envelope integrity protein TolA [Candidatus Profftia tarda]|uniref:cell envelope integrity protein TolA n=1 Tax=Candidatus Profftia tarda TaxID=1177216 RepID=UPI001FEC4C8D|nr:cell envelope integrity protein TolA [Candidatus Profftia tarda]